LDLRQQVHTKRITSDQYRIALLATEGIREDEDIFIQRQIRQDGVFRSMNILFSLTGSVNV
jgi:preprotein translocase subunit SecB